MVRLTFRSAVGVLLAALATGCLGGQTGQPDSLECGASELAPSAAWSGTTVQGAARAFEGTYSAALQWQVEPRSATAHTPVELRDSVQLTITYDGAEARRDCSDQLIVPVAVTLTTSASGVSETAPATLSIARSTQPTQGLAAGLHVDGKLVRLDAALKEVALGAAPQGSLDSLDANLPGASATFSEAPQ